MLRQLNYYLIFAAILFCLLQPTASLKIGQKAKNAVHEQDSDAETVLDGRYILTRTKDDL